jgi:fructose-bisphosphate aldolase class II
MPVATPEIYADMLDRAKAGGFAYPAINVTSSETVNAALRGFADAGSDGIIQVSTGGAEFASGTSVKEMVTGAVALAEYAHVVAAKYSINIALHTDHCQKDKLDTYVRPLIAISQQRVDAGQNPLFQSHMWDGSAIEMEENLQIADELLAKAAKARIILELEIGVVGGEEDGVVGEMNEKLYTTAGDALRTAEVLGTGERRAATCWRRPSATSTACTSRATSNSAPRSSTSCSRRSARSSARRSPSTSSSTAGQGPRWRRFARPSAMAW